MSVIPSPAPVHDRQLGPAAARSRFSLMTLVKVTVTAGSLWYVSRHVDPRGLRESLAHVSVPLLGLSLVFFLLIAVLGGARWWLLLRATGHAANFATLTALFWAGMLMNQIVPSAAGDTVRVWLSVRRGYALQAAINSIFLDRVLMLLLLLAIVLATHPLLARLVPHGQHIWIPALLLLAGGGGVCLLAIADQLSARFSAWRLVRWLSVLSSDTRRVTVSIWAPSLALLCIISNLNFVAAGWVLGDALGLKLQLVDYLAFMPLVVMVTVIPISVSGWGVREGLVVTLLGQVGISAHAALAFSLMFGAMTAASSLPGLAFWWLHPDQTRKVRS